MDTLTAKQIGTLEWWTVREVANRWRCSPDTILRMIDAGDIRAMRFGKRGDYRIHQTVIEGHERRAVTPTVAVRKPRKVCDVPDLVGDLSDAD